MTTPTESLPALIAKLNALSISRWPDNPPTYTFSKRGKTPTWFIHRRIDRGPWLPAEDLFARGPLEHVKAKVRSAIRSAQPATG